MPDPLSGVLSRFRGSQGAETLRKRIGALSASLAGASIMEVCGTHTASRFRYGLPSLLPGNIRMMAGPGCPVCVTPPSYIDRAIAISERGAIIATFGDLLRVPGSRSSLERRKGEGGDVRVLFSPSGAVDLALKNPGRRVVFLSIGFETTTPLIAATIKRTRRMDLENLSFLTSNRRMPPVMRSLAIDEEVRIDGFICPGHVSAIIGIRAYRFIPENYFIPCVVSGFEPLDILRSLEMILRQLHQGRAEVENEYSRLVKEDGNPVALDLMDEVFEVCDAEWRGIGVIPESGFRIREEFGEFDSARVFDIDVPPPIYPKGCICGEILKGVKEPPDCVHFGRACTPSSPVGACMVSREGTCSTFFHYRGQHSDTS